MSKNYIQHRFLPKGSAKKVRTCLSFYDLQKHGLVPPLIQSPFALNLLEDISTDNRGSFHNQSDEDSFLLKTRGAYFLCKRESCYARRPPPLPSLPLVHTFYLQIVILFCKAPPPSPLPLPLLHTFTYFLFANRNLVLQGTPSPPITPIAVALSSSVISISAPGQLPLHSLRPLIALIRLHHQSCSIMQQKENM